MSHSGKRRSIFKKGKGGAFLNFLIGEIALVAVAGAIYLFILQGNIPLPAYTGDSAATASPTPTVEATVTPVPTEVATLVPTATPTPAPTGTPVPPEQLSMTAGEDAPEVPMALDDSLKLGLSEVSAFTEAEQNVLTVGGYAFIEGRDAAKSSLYLTVYNAETGVIVGMYPATITPENANLSFDESSGENLTNAFFTVKVDVSGYQDNSYILSMLVVNEDKVAINFFDNRTYHFIIEEGALAVIE